MEDDGTVEKTDAERIVESIEEGLAESIAYNERVYNTFKDWIK